MKNTAVVLILFGLLAASAATQSTATEPVESNMPQDPGAWIAYMHDSPADLDASGREAGKATVHRVAAVGSAPILWDDPLKLFGGVNLQATRFDFEDADTDNVNAYTIAGMLDAIYEGFYPWQVIASLQAGLFSDMKEVDGDDAKVLGAAMALYPWTPRVTFAAGVAYDQVFGDDEWFPLGGVVWKPSSEWELQMIFPSPKLLYAPNRDVVFFLKMEPAGENWSVSVDDQEYNFRVENIRFGGGAEYALNAHTWFRLEAGLNTERTYTIWEGDKRVIEADAEDSLYMGIALLVR